MPKWRKDSTFDDGRRVPLDREQRAVFRARLTFKAFRRPGRLTVAAVQVGHILVDKLGADGRLDPSIQTLAILAGVDPTTVTRALDRLRGCGFVTWTRRLSRGADTGWRTEQRSNAYVLHVQAACDVQFAQPVLKRLFKKKAGRQPTSDKAIRESDQAAREQAARQLVALGRPVPAEWGLG